MKSFPITRPSFSESEIQSVSEVLESGWVTQGPMTNRFEELFSERHEVGHSLATTSCTSALHLAAMALDLGPGDEVIVPAMTWVTSAYSVEYVGAKVVFVDVDLSTFNLDLDALESAITSNTRAIVAVHLFGLAIDMERLKAIASHHDLAIIEDAACAVGSSFRGKPVGGLGDIGCFSFHPRKAITTGEGGMVTTNDSDLASKVASLRNHGAGVPDQRDPDFGKPYFMGPFEMVGYNLRLSDIQAAVGVAQMAKLENILDERKFCADRYHKLLGDCDDLALPIVSDEFGHTYQSYVIRVLEGGRQRRNTAMEHLADCRIQTRPGTHAVHRLGYYSNKYGIDPVEFPNACLGEDTTITLPIFPGMEDDDQGFIVEQLRIGLNK